MFTAGVHSHLHAGMYHEDHRPKPGILPEQLERLRSDHRLGFPPRPGAGNRQWSFCA